MRSYLRNWELKLIPFTRNADQSITELPSEQHKSFKDLRITFNITSTQIGDPATANFQLYNLNSRTIRLLTDNDYLVQFRSSYGGHPMSDLFRGEVSNAYTIRQGPDTVYNIWARDSGTALDYRFPTDTPRPRQTETSNADLLQEIVNANPAMTNKQIAYIGSARSRLQALRTPEYSFSGTMRNQITNLISQAGLVWTIRFGQLRVLYTEENSNVTLTGEEPIKVNVGTGLLTRPKLNYVGIDFKHLLDGRFHPDTIIDIEPTSVELALGNELYVPVDDKFDLVEGPHRIMEVKMKGDTRGELWEADIKAFRV